MAPENSNTVTEKNIPLMENPERNKLFFNRIPPGAGVCRRFRVCFDFSLAESIRLYPRCSPPRRWRLSGASSKFCHWLTALLEMKVS
jgi:hypothetical protein